MIINVVLGFAEDKALVSKTSSYFNKIEVVLEELDRVKTL